MKNLLIVVSFFIFASCSNSYIENGESKINPKQETTLEVLEEMDTSITYYLYVDEDELHAINSQSRVVEYRVVDRTGFESGAALLLFIILLFLMVTLLVIID